MISPLSLFTALSLALLIGTEFAVSAFINPIVGRLELSARIDATRRFAALLGKVMPIWYAFDFLLLIADATIRRHQPRLAELVAALCIWAAAIIFSLVSLVPINNRITQLSGNSVSEQALREHKLWDTLHRVRVAALCAAFLAYLLGISA